MWRSYDMADGSQEWDLPVSDRAAVAESHELDVSWQIPRLALHTEFDRHDRIVRIPPGFVSC